MKVTYFNACERPEMEVEKVLEREVPDVLEMVKALADQSIEHYGDVTIHFFVDDPKIKSAKGTMCVAWMEVREEKRGE